MHPRAPSARPSHPDHSAAFTLVELLIVVVILALTALIIVPGVGRNDAATLSSAARLLISDLEYAQIESVGNGANPCLLVVDIAHNRYFIARTDNPDAPIAHPVSGRPYEIIFGGPPNDHLSGVAFAEIDFGPDSALGFTPFGSLDQSTSATISLSSGSYQIKLVVNAATGETSIVE